MRDKFRIVRDYSGWAVECMPAYHHYWQHRASFDTFDQAAEWLYDNTGLSVSVAVVND